MILNETQEDLDRELSQILNLSISDVKSKEIASPNNIRVFAGDTIPDDYSILYKNFEHLDLVGYLRTLMYTSIHYRGKELIKLLRSTNNKICLDFGSGVGSHTIALMENGNFVSLLDVNGPLMQFALKRIERRGLSHLCDVYFAETLLPANHYDLVICTNVLEHVVDPIYELERITQALKLQGLLHLVVSKMIKNSSGHFAKTIRDWKQRGPAFLEKYYTKVGSSLYRRNK